jgi:hypothetical protein
LLGGIYMRVVNSTSSNLEILAGGKFGFVSGAKYG